MPALVSSAVQTDLEGVRVILKAIVSVLGIDRPGIIATVSRVLYEGGANILDISQTVLGDNMFVMTMWVELGDKAEQFSALKEQLESAGQQIGMEIRIQREEIFNAMYRI